MSKEEKRHWLEKSDQLKFGMFHRTIPYAVTAVYVRGRAGLMPFPNMHGTKGTKKTKDDGKVDAKIAERDVTQFASI
jgi:hypothetical protein